MMGFRVIVALLLLSLHIEVDSSQSPSDEVSKSETAEHFHHHQRRSSVWGLFMRTFKQKKEKKKEEDRFSDNIKWEKAINVQNGVYFYDELINKYYIARDKDCIPVPCAYNAKEQRCLSSVADGFLVNVDDFEILEWTQLEKGKIPPLAVETCNGLFIAKHKKGLGYVKERGKTITIGSDKYHDGIEVLTLNDIKEEYLTNVQFNSQLRQANKRPAVFNKFTVVNKNCEAMKQQIKLDSGSEETASYQIGKTVLIGGSVGFKKIVEANIKADFGGSESETKSNIKKKTYGYFQEIEIPANSSCIVEIRSVTSMTVVPFTAEVTRVYEGGDIRTTSISGNYTFQETTDINTEFQTCKKLNVPCTFPKIITVTKI